MTARAQRVSLNRRAFNGTLLTSVGLLGGGIATTSAQSTHPMLSVSCTPDAPITPDMFAAYIDAFNKDDYAAFGHFYADDVVLVISGNTELRGRQAIFDFYQKVKSQTRRTIQINRVIATATHLAAELQSEFLALADLPDFTAGPMKKGGRIFINTFVFYELREGKFSRIRSAAFRKIARG